MPFYVAYARCFYFGLLVSGAPMHLPLFLAYDDLRHPSMYRTICFVHTLSIFQYIVYIALALNLDLNAMLHQTRTTHEMRRE